ncbi:MAG: flagellar basal body-associated FliL family protein [Treponema sp.]|jgi:flagellar FliL protein|nr:flagellar basal body-associated FliL family protein [Treponema sp.]
MSNADDDNIDLGGDDGDAGADSKKKKGAGFAMLLPNLLKFVAIGLGAIVVVITISVITVNIVIGSGKSQTTVPENDAYVGTKPTYSIFSALPVIRTNTKDIPPYSVVVEMFLGYDLNNATAATELTSRLVELQDFTRNYFSNKFHVDLQPDKEETLKNDLMEKMNRLLNTAKIRAIYFKQLSTMEM